MFLNKSILTLKFNLLILKLNFNSYNKNNNKKYNNKEGGSYNNTNKKPQFYNNNKHNNNCKYFHYFIFNSFSVISKALVKSPIV